LDALVSRPEVGVSGVREGVRVRVREAMSSTAFAFIVLLPVAASIEEGEGSDPRRHLPAVR
jgi:hypothetical protein